MRQASAVRWVIWAEDEAASGFRIVMRTCLSRNGLLPRMLRAAHVEDADGFGQGGEQFCEPGVSLPPQAGGEGARVAIISQVFEHDEQDPGVQQVDAGPAPV
jgi:hypothetical protein